MKAYGHLSLDTDMILTAPRDTAEDQFILLQACVVLTETLESLPLARLGGTVKMAHVNPRQRQEDIHVFEASPSILQREF